MSSSLVRLLALVVSLLTASNVCAQASVEITEEVPPPPEVESTVPPTPAQELAVPVPPTQPAAAQPTTVQPTTVQPTAQVYQWNPSAPTPEAAYGNPVRPPRRGDSLEDTAQAGEIIDLMLTSGAYGMLIGNGIVNWSGIDARGGDELVSIRFGATFLGATLSLTGLFAMGAPRGTPTAMAVGLRYGSIAGGMMAGALGGSGNDALGALVIGGVLGYGLGAGLGFGLRPHVSRTRFVEAGVFWGTSLGFLVAGAARSSSRETWGLGLGGMTVGILTNTLVASLNRVSVGRGWLLNAGFVVPAALGALAVILASNGSPDQSVTYGVAIATGLIGLGVVFAVSDGIQDPGWVEDNEVLASLQLGVGPSADGSGGAVSISGAF